MFVLQLSDVLLLFLFCCLPFAVNKDFHLSIRTNSNMQTTVETRNVFCFNGFNQTAIILRYSAHIKPRKTLKQETLRINTI